MFAVGVIRGKSGIQDFNLPRPEIHSRDEVLVRIKEVGLDGTDFNLLRYNLQDFPEGRDEMAIGHEGLGVVESVGPAVKSLKPGDRVAVTVRRGCGECAPCLHNASDMCATGRYQERGLHKLDGFLTQYVVDSEQYVVKLPEQLGGLAVLTEPLSIIEKGVEQLRIIQSRLRWTCEHPEHAFLLPDWGGCKTALVVGSGPLGILAIAVLRLAGVAVYSTDIVAPQSPKIALVRRLGADYVDSSQNSAGELIQACAGEGQIDILFEASGAAEPALELLKYMSRNSISVMTGIPREEMLMQIDAAQLVRQIVRSNLVIVGSVNSNRTHYEIALSDLQRLAAAYPGVLDAMVTQRVKLQDYAAAFGPKDDRHIKTVVEIEPWG